MTRGVSNAPLQQARKSPDTDLPRSRVLRSGDPVAGLSGFGRSSTPCTKGVLGNALGVGPDLDRVATLDLRGDCLIVPRAAADMRVRLWGHFQVAVSALDWQLCGNEINTTDVSSGSARAGRPRDLSAGKLTQELRELIADIRGRQRTTEAV